jgi:hypothetical protein
MSGLQLAPLSATLPTPALTRSGNSSYIAVGVCPYGGVR